MTSLFIAKKTRGQPWFFFKIEYLILPRTAWSSKGHARVQWFCRKLSGSYIVQSIQYSLEGMKFLLCFEYRISNKEFRTAEVFRRNRALFFTSIFCGSYSRRRDSWWLNVEHYQGGQIRRSWSSLRGQPKVGFFEPGFFTVCWNWHEDPSSIEKTNRGYYLPGHGKGRQEKWLDLRG